MHRTVWQFPRYLSSKTVIACYKSGRVSKLCVLCPHCGVLHSREVFPGPTPAMRSGAQGPVLHAECYSDTPADTFLGVLRSLVSDPGVSLISSRGTKLLTCTVIFVGVSCFKVSSLSHLCN